MSRPAPLPRSFVVTHVITFLAVVTLVVGGMRYVDTKAAKVAAQPAAVSSPSPCPSPSPQ